MRLKAAKNLRIYVEAEAREMSGGTFSKFMTETTNRIYDLVSSAEAHERIGGIMAIDELIEVPCEDNETKIIRFANYLRMVFQQTSAETSTLVQASRALGHLARAGGTVAADFVEFELKRSIDWLQCEPRGDAKRYAAVLVLKELAANSPVLFSPLIPAFFEHIWVAIQSDGKPIVREAAVEALRAVLVIISKRSDEELYRNQWFNRIQDQMSEGFRLAETGSIHGSLLVIGELLRNTGTFMHARYADTCKIVFAYKAHRSHLVQRATIQLQPQLAAYNPEHYTEKWLEQTMPYLIGVLQERGDHYDVAFAAVGDLALAVGSAIMQFTPQIVDLVNTALASQSKWKKSGSDTNEALRCVWKLAKAVGPSLAPQIESLVDQMFAAGLSRPLLDVLGELARSTPSLLPAVQTRLLSCISAVLAAPGAGDNRDGPQSTDRDDQLPSSGVPADESTVILALNALSAFGADDPRARSVVSDSVVWYFDHESPTIRREAALTVTRLLLPSPEQIAAAESSGAITPLRSPFLGSNGSSATEWALRAAHGFSHRIVMCQTHQLLSVAALIRRVLVFATSDPDPPTRRRVFQSFDARFDPFLCEPRCIALLAQALHDEDLFVRKAIVQIMGRLTHHNPAYVVPALRKLLIQVLAELECSIELRHKEEATEMLSAMSLHARRLLEPYVGAVARCLLKKLREASAEGCSKLVAHLLDAIGQLSEVSGQEMQQFLPDLLPLLVDAIQDHGGGASSLRREQLEHAYRALRMVVENTGYVIEPYDKYPLLLPLLIDTLRSDAHTGDWQHRQQIIRCIGTLGALDPARVQRLASSKSDPVGGGDGPAIALLEGEKKAQTWPWLSSGYHHAKSSIDGAERTDLFSAHAVAALLKMLNDSSLVSQHTQVIQVLMKIFKSIDHGCVPFLPQIMAAFMQVLRTLESAERQVLLRHLADLVRIAGTSMAAYLQDVFEVIGDIWREPSARTPDGDSVGTTFSLLTLMEEISRCHPDALKAYLGSLLPSILGLLHQRRNNKHRVVATQVLRTIVVFGHTLGDFLHLVIPALIRRCEEEGDCESTDLSIRECAIRALGELSKELQFPHLLSRVVHPLLRILDAPSSHSELKDASIDTLVQLHRAFDGELSIFLPQIRRVLLRQRLNAAGAALLEPPKQGAQTLHDGDASRRSFLASGADLSAAESLGLGVSASHENAFGDPSGREMQPNQHSLRQAWEASHRSTKDDWVEWMRRLTLELLRESACPALRACWALAQVYHPLSRELFHASFLSCWLHLYDPYQDALARSLETAVHSPTLPPDILQALLNLAEFMDRSGLPLPIDARTLGGLSEKCHAYAKALRYKEAEFATSPTTCVEALISINTQLQQAEAAQGILVYAQKHLGVESREAWYERLHRWDDALEAYELRGLEDPGNLEWTKSRMRCLNELGEWPRLSRLAQSVWEDHVSTDRDSAKKEMAPLAAAAEFHLRDWDRMGLYVDSLDGSRNSYEGCLYSAILAIHRESYRQAHRLISRAREALDPELTALVGESYTRAYRSLVKVQQLTELEEVIKYKTTDREQTREGIKAMWTNRLNGCQSNVHVWQSALQIRSIVVPPTEDLATWLKYCSLCRRASRLDLAMKTLDQLRSDPTAARDPRLIVAYLKNRHAAGAKRQACREMRGFLAEAGGGQSGAAPSLLARCHLKMGLWTRELFEEEAKPWPQREVLGWFQSAIELNSADYKAWNAWALTNYQIVEAIEAERARAADDASNGGSSPRLGWRVPRSNIETSSCRSHVLHAVQGFVKSIVLAKKTALQDILRLLTLWFRYADEPEVAPALREGFEATPLSAWLKVLPQILARLRSTSEGLREMIRELLSRVAKTYPQAVVFPLTVAAKSTVDSIASIARSLLQGMRDDGSEELVRQSEMVSDELIRISILWHEKWCDALEEASRLYYAESDPDAMIKVLIPLHEQLQQVGPQTMREVAFQQAFSRELQEALRWIRRFQKSGQKSDTDQAWQSYYMVFRKIRIQVQGLSHLDMQSVSPSLLNARNLELAVPGTYAAEGERGGGSTVVTIRSFSASIEVLTSKQRPRILQLMGSDGKSYQFLLKGHEDLKQDERVMQLFRLINSLLADHAERGARGEQDLSIARFAVVPLSANSGLIEWVPECDTLHQLIKMYRESRHVQLSVEYQLMKSVCSRCEDLSVLQKVEVFRHALRCTSGMDLQRVLWLQSRNSEVWLTRRTTYCRSLAVMSVVGYILGLGDRHPSNLMIARESGQVVHIDFGDCFEIAAFREKFPEKIPFRLTRMLLNALEVSGVEGNYRHTCELLMCLLRNHKDAVMAMLEAFVFDPLITWRLLPTRNQRAQQTADVWTHVRRTQAVACSPLQSHLVAGQPPPPLFSRQESAAAHAVFEGGAKPVPLAAPLVGPPVASAAMGAAVGAATTSALATVGGVGGAAIASALAGFSGDVEGDPVASNAPAGTTGVIDRAAAAGVELVVDNQRLAPPYHQHFVCDEPTTVERDPHLASVRSKQARHRDLRQHLGPEGVQADPQLLSATGRQVISRVYAKLNGTDFGCDSLDVEAQVERLFQEATSHENLCQCYVGWCPFW